MDILLLPEGLPETASPLLPRRECWLMPHSYSLLQRSCQSFSLKHKTDTASIRSQPGHYGSRSLGTVHPLGFPLHCEHSVFPHNPHLPWLNTDGKEAEDAQQVEHRILCGPLR